MALGRLARALEAAAAAVQRFFVEGGFPAFALFLLAFWELLLVGLALVPPAPSGLGAFAAEFRVWCFGFDPATGRYQVALVLAMLTPPFALAGLLLLVWWEPLGVLARRRAALALHACAAAAVVGVAAGAFAALRTDSEPSELPFPAEALRTAFRAPDLRLVNQIGESVDLDLLRGRVVLLTAVYEQCSQSCPSILEQARRAVDTLPVHLRSELRVVGVTLDPAGDTPERLARLAARHVLEPPLYQLVTGTPAEVESVLDQMSVARRRDGASGVIDHTNLFLLVDRQGKLAYRFSLGPRQERWLGSALRLLLEERSDGG
jgi:cytochrome oxidase Cu insertion factor (SCO1/SenC/PrrC family)